MNSSDVQPALPLLEFSERRLQNFPNSSLNTLKSGDRAFHDWYRFVLSFPPHLVREYIQDFSLNETTTLLDPFCGTGTTLVEGKLANVPTIGLEANPFPHFASTVKTTWNIDPHALLKWAHEVADKALQELHAQGVHENRSKLEKAIQLQDLAPDAKKILIKDSISPLPLHKTLVLLSCLRARGNPDYQQYGLLALGKALVFSISNLRFGPEVGVGKPKEDAPVVRLWLNEVDKMCADLEFVNSRRYAISSVFLADARELTRVVPPNSIDAVITSPPYPNEKDYTRTTRLESVILGFYHNKVELQNLKRRLLRSNTRGVYVTDDDDQWIAGHSQIQQLADAVEQRRLELGKTSGFEKLYGRVTRLYFGGMAKHLAELRAVLRPGARLAYVVGDQASYLQVMIRTGQLLAEIASSLGYEVVRIDLFRTRFATATQTDLREEVVILRWPGR